jgi:DNA transposition AAA+ family ATPase
MDKTQTKRGSDHPDQKIQVVGEQSPLGNEKLRLWLVNHIGEHPHLSTRELARSMGSNRTALDQFIAGKYFLPREQGGQGVNPGNSNLERLVQAYRERVEGTNRHGYAGSFVRTRTFFQVQKACGTALEENAIVVVYGPPGVGKSRCLLEFSVGNQRRLPISILCSRNITPKYFCEVIAAELEVPHRGASIPRIEDSIAAKLVKSPRVLFIDQANYLSEKSLGTICYVWDKARVPVVLLGTNELHNLFVTSKLTEDVRKQLSRRVALHYPLEPLTADELKTLIKRALGDAASDEVIAEIGRETGGLFGYVDAMLPRTLELMKTHAADLDAGRITMTQIIHKAAAKLMLD